MKRETYKGRKIKVVAGRGADHGYTRITLNGVDMGKWMQSEDEALRSTRGTIDHADETGLSSGRYGAEWFVPGSFELCDVCEGTKEIGGECGHAYCVRERAEAAASVGTCCATEFYSSEDWYEHRLTHAVERAVDREIQDLDFFPATDDARPVDASRPTVEQELADANEYDEPACEGHNGEDDDLLRGVNIGETTYCDGSCNVR